MKKLALIVTAMAVAPSLAFAAPAFADSPGQLSSGPTMYQVKNVTQNGTYASNANATCNDVVKYSFQVANSEFGLLKDVTVKANLATGSATATAVNSVNETTSVTGNVAVTVAKGNLVYVAGSTQNFDVNGNLIKTLADGVTVNGVNKGNLNGSTREFVQFQAKVVCETTPPVTPVTPETPATPAVAPAKIASTGPTNAVATMLGLSTITAGIGYFVQRRRNILG